MYNLQAISKEKKADLRREQGTRVRTAFIGFRPVANSPEHVKEPLKT
jgi:hypothetical protein